MSLCPPIITAGGFCFHNGEARHEEIVGGRCGARCGGGADMGGRVWGGGKCESSIGLLTAHNDAMKTCDLPYDVAVYELMQRLDACNETLIKDPDWMHAACAYLIQYETIIITANEEVCKGGLNDVIDHAKVVYDERCASNLRKTRPRVMTSVGLTDLYPPALNRSMIATMQCLATVTHDRRWKLLAAELAQYGVSQGICPLVAEQYADTQTLFMYFSQNPIAEACGGMHVIAEFVDYLEVVLENDCDFYIGWAKSSRSEAEEQSQRNDQWWFDSDEQE